VGQWAPGYCGYGATVGTGVQWSQGHSGAWATVTPGNCEQRDQTNRLDARTGWELAGYFACPDPNNRSRLISLITEKSKRGGNSAEL